MWLVSVFDGLTSEGRAFQIDSAAYEKRPLTKLACASLYEWNVLKRFATRNTCFARRCCCCCCCLLYFCCFLIAYCCLFFLLFSFLNLPFFGMDKRLMKLNFTPPWTDCSNIPHQSLVSLRSSAASACTWWSIPSTRNRRGLKSKRRRGWECTVGTFSRAPWLRRRAFFWWAAWWRRGDEPRTPTACRWWWEKCRERGRSWPAWRRTWGPPALPSAAVPGNPGRRSEGTPQRPCGSPLCGRLGARGLCPVICCPLAEG